MLVGATLFKNVYGSFVSSRITQKLGPIVQYVSTDRVVFLTGVTSYFQDGAHDVRPSLAAAASAGVG